MDEISEEGQFDELLRQIIGWLCENNENYVKTVILIEKIINSNKYKLSLIKFTPKFAIFVKLRRRKHELKGLIILNA